MSVTYYTHVIGNIFVDHLQEEERFRGLVELNFLADVIIVQRRTQGFNVYMKTPNQALTHDLLNQFICTHMSCRVSHKAQQAVHFNDQS